MASAVPWLFIDFSVGSLRWSAQSLSRCRAARHKRAQELRQSEAGQIEEVVAEACATARLEEVVAALSQHLTQHRPLMPDKPL